MVSFSRKLYPKNVSRKNCFKNPEFRSPARSFRPAHSQQHHRATTRVRSLGEITDPALISPERSVNQAAIGAV